MKTIALALLAASCWAAPLQYNGEYSLNPAPYTGPIGPPYVSSSFAISGPNGDRVFWLVQVDALGFILSNTGLLAISGASVGDEFIALLDYHTTPTETPLFLYDLWRLQIESWDRPQDYPKDYVRDNGWNPQLTIRNHNLLAVIQIETWRPDLPWTRIIELQLVGGFGPAPIPEPGTIGLFVLAGLGAWVRRAIRK